MTICTQLRYFSLDQHGQSDGPSLPSFVCLELMLQKKLCIETLSTLFFLLGFSKWLTHLSTHVVYTQNKVIERWEFCKGYQCLESTNYMTSFFFRKIYKDREVNQHLTCSCWFNFPVCLVWCGSRATGILVVFFKCVFWLLSTVFWK